MHPAINLLIPFLLPLQVAEEKRVDPASQPVVLRATGIGKPTPGKPAAQAKLMARRAAEVVALRNLAAQVQGRTPTETGGTLHTATDGLIRGYRFLPPRDLPDGTVEVTVELPLQQLHANHVEIADRVKHLEDELRATRQRLETARQHHARVQAVLEARIAAAERELAELRRLLDELKSAAQENAGDESPAP
ncbi:MAG TPA: hypothetical protein VGM03_22825 [Phycisphaerae bacterium]